MFPDHIRENSSIDCRPDGKAHNNHHHKQPGSHHDDRQACLQRGTQSRLRVLIDHSLLRTVLHLGPHVSQATTCGATGFTSATNGWPAAWVATGSPPP